MFPFPQLFFLLGIFFSLTLTDALAEPAPTLPSDIGGAVLWLKADDVQGGNGTVVTEWKSRVRDLIATPIANVSPLIVLKQTTGNNKPAIFFSQSPANGEYRYFEIPSNFHLKNSTVLVSLKYEGSAASPQVLSFLGGAWNLQNSRFDIDDDPGSREDALGLSHNGNQFELTSNRTKSQSPTYTKGDWTTLSYRIDGNGNMTVSLNGVPGNQTSKPSMASQNTAGKLHIGLSGPKRRTDKENLDNAYIYEIIIFNRCLNDDDYKEVQGYMQASMDASSVQVVSLPTASSINRGELLSQSVLAEDGSATSNGTAVDGKFKWSDGSIEVTQSGNYSAIFVPDSAKYYSSEEVQVRVTVKPELNTLPDSLTGFRTRNGTVSSSKSFSISGTNLTSNVTASVLLGSGFEVSTDNSTFGSNTTIPVVSGNVSATLYVRLAAAQTSVGNKTATINISFGALSDKSVMLKGTVAEVSDPYIEVTPEVLTLPVTTAGTPSTSANFTVNAYNLSGNLTANATVGLEISLENGTFSQNLEIPLIGGNATTPINLRVSDSAIAGALSGSVTLTSGNTTASLSANGTVNAPAPSIIVTPEVLAGFLTTAGMPSASANFTVNAYNLLSGNLTANATTGFEIALGNGTYAQTLEIPIAGGNVTTSLNLRVAASAIAGALSGSVTLTSGNTTASLTANGTVNAPIQRTLPAPAPTPAAESPTPENSKKGKKIKKQQLKKKPKKKKKSVFSFPPVVATSGSTWITADGKVVSENQQPQSNTSK